jgi:hypothetical protein
MSTVKAVKLTPTMVDLLTDVATHPQMYIDANRQWNKTAHALISRGLAYVVDERHLYNPYQIRITDAGKAEAKRRRILAADA